MIFENKDFIELEKTALRKIHYQD